MSIPASSAISDIVWPAIPGPRAAATFAVLFQLERSQWWTAEEIQRRQQRQSLQVLRHAVRHVPHYRESVPSGVCTNRHAIDPDQWLQIPILERDVVQSAAQTLTSEAVPKGHGALGRVRTSGSTGKPVETVGTEVTRFFWRAFTLRDHLWHRRNFSGKLAAIRQFDDSAAAPPGGLRTDEWGDATRGILETGPSAMLDVMASISDQVPWLVRENPDYLLTFPSNLLALAKQFRDEGLRLPALREVRTIGEVMTDEVRHECYEAWGVPLTDLYSTQEVGYIALECPEQRNYHVQSENVLVEVLDDRGRPCEPGEVGRVVLTTLHNFAMPLVRYEVGDYGVLGPPCPCGRGLPVLERILGRQRNMFVLPNGDQRWPTLAADQRFDDAFGDLPPIRQFQVIQRSVQVVEVRLVTSRPFDHEEERRLAQYLDDCLGHAFQYAFRYVPEIPRRRSGKFEDFICALGSSVGDEL
jgi:phenylacetate-CoA ligase